MNLEVSANEIGSLADAAVAWLIAFTPHLIAATLVVVVGLTAARWLSIGVSRGLQRAGHLDRTLHPILVSVVQYGATLLVLLIALNQLGVQTTSLIAVIGAAGIAIGLALQGTLSNIAAGLMLLWLRPFRVGDYIEVANQNISGEVLEIGLFVSRLQSADGPVVIAPNATIWTFSLRNYSRVQRRLVAAEITVPLSADPKAVCTALGAALAAADFAMVSPAPKVVVEAVTGDGYQLTMLFWSNTASVAKAIQSLHSLTEQGLASAGIQLESPFRLTRTLPAPGAPSVYEDLMRAPG